MDLAQVRLLVQEDWAALQDFMGRILGSNVKMLQSLNAEVLSHAGKQLRPLLCLLAARACSGKSNESTLRYAAACELLHNATLLHDDVADESDLRRGRPTVRSLMGPAVSVLLGDYWLARAVESIAGDEQCNREVISIYARTLGNLSEGEMFQLEKAASGDTDEQDYIRIIYGKTASLFEASALSGACSVRACHAQKQAAADYAKNIGIAFQIRDDIFDYSPSLNTGKPSLADVEEKKITLPLLGAFKQSDHQLEEEIRAEIVEQRPGVKEKVMEYVCRYGGVQYAQQKLNEYIQNAVNALVHFEDSPYKEAMKCLAEYVAIREV